MPAFVGILKGIGDAIQGYLTNAKIDNNMRVALHFAAELSRGVQNGVAGAWWGLERIREGAENDRGAVVHTGAQFGRALAELRICLRHLTDTVIPNTAAHTVGYVYVNYVKPLRKENVEQYNLIYDLFNAVVPLQNWRRDKVDPFIGNVTRLAGWIGGFDSFPALYDGNAKTWVWFTSWLFHDFNNVTGYLLARRPSSDNTAGLGLLQWFLAQQEHQGALDDLLAILIDGSPDRYRHIINATETILESPYP